MKFICFCLVFLVTAAFAQTTLEWTCEPESICALDPYPTYPWRRVLQVGREAIVFRDSTGLVNETWKQGEIWERCLVLSGFPNSECTVTSTNAWREPKPRFTICWTAPSDNPTGGFFSEEIASGEWSAPRQVFHGDSMNGAFCYCPLLWVAPVDHRWVAGYWTSCHFCWFGSESDDGETWEPWSRGLCGYLGGIGVYRDVNAGNNHLILASIFPITNSDEIFFWGIGADSCLPDCWRLLPPSREVNVGNIETALAGPNDEWQGYIAYVNDEWHFTAIRDSLGDSLSFLLPSTSWWSDLAGSSIEPVMAVGWSDNDTIFCGVIDLSEETITQFPIAPGYGHRISFHLEERTLYVAWRDILDMLWYREGIINPISSSPPAAREKSKENPIQLTATCNGTTLNIDYILSDRFQQGEIRLYNILGQLVVSQVERLMYPSGHLTLSVPFLPSGIYFCVLQTPRAAAYTKAIVLQ